MNIFLRPGLNEKLPRARVVHESSVRRQSRNESIWRKIERGNVFLTQTH